MSVITFWNNGKEQTGKTLSITAITTQMSIEHNYKILVISTGHKDTTLDRCFWEEKRKKKNRGLFGPNTNTAMEDGIVGIETIMRSGKLQPENIEDIVAVNALYRPGPMENIDSFVKRKKGLEPITYPDHRLISILKNTYGIIVYQEQIMQVAAVMAGNRLGQADILRRAISKKKASLIDEERIHFVEGAKKQGFTREKAEEVYQYIEKFSHKSELKQNLNKKKNIKRYIDK